jgi:enterochelin esterase family protein
VREAVAERVPWPEAARTISWGASLGGTAAIWLAATRPDLFGRSTSQSGVLGPVEPASGLDDAPGDPAARCFQEGYAAPTYLECGSFEEFIAGNREAATRLRERGVRHEYRERHTGHSWLGWRQGIGPALRFHLAAV